MILLFDIKNTVYIDSDINQKHYFKNSFHIFIYSFPSLRNVFFFEEFIFVLIFENFLAGFQGFLKKIARFF